jgi:hypothetical protein
MSRILVTATLPHVSAFPEDAFSNSFPFLGNVGDSAALVASEVMPAVAAFYTNVQSTSQSVGTWIGPGVSRSSNACQLKAYDITGHEDGSPHGSPIATSTFTMPAAFGGEVPLPEEVALVVTTRGGGWTTAPIEAPDGSDPGAAIDRPRQRHSGRLYLGPFGETSNVASSGKARPDTTLITTILDACEDLQVAANANGHDWSVWSRTDADLRQIIEVQVDNAWDTQRRRGVAATSRTVRAI